MRYLSFGAAVNTIGLLLLYPEVYYNDVIFADMGVELPKTMNTLMIVLSRF